MFFFSQNLTPVGIKNGTLFEYKSVQDEVNKWHVEFLFIFPCFFSCILFPVVGLLEQSSGCTFNNLLGIFNICITRLRLL